MRSEHEQVLANVSGFIERHGDVRFSSVESDPAHTPMVRDRAGWWRDDARERVYLFNSEGLTEALGGFDPKRGTEALEVAGWLVERESEKRSVRLTINGSRRRVYAICPAEGEEGPA